ncbi:hypothetical protein VB735_04595 [Halotia wernerae UHCC 0503]|nr:hypothetical protein [Halotia wernerae UHCC 0503]
MKYPRLLTWSDPTAYDQKARKLAQMFIDNFQQFADIVEPKVLGGEPVVAK